ncbi:MAG: hypothetical protein LAT51_12450, partial [Flavobacteriaceae bacterium]|nr:hypothetical protein [Flavobacteriaceae bacterium]
STLPIARSVDFHAYSHILDQHDHHTVADCEHCEEFVVMNQLDFDVIHFNDYEVLEFISYKETILTQLFFKAYKLHQGEYYNKPPPFIA